MAYKPDLSVYWKTETSIPGSGPFGRLEHVTWLGQPWHALAFPASSLPVPGQSSRKNVIDLVTFNLYFLNVKPKTVNTNHVAYVLKIMLNKWYFI